jgi:hypothetical protein
MGESARRAFSSVGPTSTVATARSGSGPVAASGSPPGPTTRAPPRKSSRPKLPVWLAEATISEFSAARERSHSSERRHWRSSVRTGAGLLALRGHALRKQRISAPSRVRVRAASGKALS